MVRLKRAALVGIVVALGFAATGCRHLGSVLVTHHPNSCYTAPYEPEIIVDEEPLALEWALIAEGVGFVVEQVAKGVQVESERYAATYSARTSGVLYRFVDDGGVLKLAPGLSRFTFQRPGADDEDNVATFVAEVQLSENAEAMLVVVESFDLKKTKSKVAGGWSLVPWQWPASLIVTLWGFADDSIYEVDVNVQVSIDVIVAEGTSGRKILHVGTVDFPMGRRPVGKLWSEDEELRGSLTSGWLPLPQVDKVADTAVLVNLTVTLVEDNDMGDVIAKGAVKLSEKKADIVAKVIEALKEE